MIMPTAGHKFLLLDAHLHLYQVHDVPWLLANLARRASPLELPASLVLSRQTGGGGWDEAVAAMAARGGWTASPVAGDRLSRDLVAAAGRVRLYFGRQIVSRERLEIAALGCLRHVPDGMGLDRVTREVLEQGGYPILVWGAGKWLGWRGRLVRRWVEGMKSGDGSLGDTSMRPLGWPEPSVMRLARRRGVRIVCGSDPMPRPADAALAGGYASLINLSGDGLPDSRGLIRLLRDPGIRVERRGRRCGPVRFLLRQATAMRLAGRSGQ